MTSKFAVQELVDVCRAGCRWWTDLGVNLVQRRREGCQGRRQGEQSAVPVDPKAEEGKSFLIYGHDWGNFEASYYNCKDQRICFRAGWPQFATQHNIGDGYVVLILFHNDNDGRLIVSFDTLSTSA